MKRLKNGTFSKQYNFNESFFNKQSHELAWLIGLLASDGHIRKNNKTVIMTQTEKEKIYYANKIINSNHNDFYLHSFNTVQILNEYNINNKKTFLYEFPTKLKKKYHSSFIAGYLEGDGCVGVYNNGRGIYYLKASIYGTIKFTHQLNEIVSTKGNINIKNDTHSEISWNGKNAINFLNWIFSYNKIYKGKKYLTFNNYLTILHKKTKSYKYDKIRNKVKELIKKEKSFIKISQQVNIPFQTIYKWKWKGLL